MIRARFNVTFETVTPESADHGEAADSGFIIEGARLSACVPHVAHGFYNPSFAGPAEPDSIPGTPRALYFTSYDEDARTGATESRALHFPAKITPASARRVARLFGVTA